MSKSKEYVKNTLILLMGKFATQFMSFLLLPLYTNYLDASDYGTIDLIHTYITFFVPVLTLRMDSVAFRFLVDCRKDSEKIKTYITNILTTTFVSIVVVSVVAVILSFFLDVPYFFFIFLNLIVLMASGVIIQILRGLGKTTLYAIASIITGSITLISNIILVVGLGYGAESILISSTIANLVCILFVFFSARLDKKLSPLLINKTITKQFLKYSIPLIPHSLSWWIINASDRTIINIFLGASFNGIYTVSCKMSNIIHSVFSIFGMSWQESASLHIDDPDRDKFFTKMINQLLMLFASAALVVLAILPLFYNIIIGEKYWSAYDYIPILLYANVWSVLTGLVGGIYVAKKRTKEIANTTIVSAIINIIIDLALINFIGLHAATISTLVSCMVMALYRTHDSKKYVNYKIDKLGLVIYSAIFAGSYALYMLNNPILNAVNLAVVAAYVFLINRKNMKSILMMLKVKRKEKNLEKND